MGLKRTQLQRGKVLVDFYPALNLGDDLFLYTLLDRYRDEHFYIVLQDTSLLPRIGADNYSVIKMQSKKSRREWTDSLGAKCLCQIGGSIFIEPVDRGCVGIARSMKYILRRYQLYSSTPHTYVLGANWGPAKHAFFQHAFKSVYKRTVDDICFRDQASFQLFRELKNVRVAPDILFSTQMPKVEKQHSVLFSVVDLSNKQKFGFLSEKADKYYAWLEHAAQWYFKRGYKVILSSFCEIEGDERAVDVLGKRLSAKGVPYQNHRYKGDINEALEVIASCDVVVATRFHAMVLGIVAGARVLPLSYSMKTINVLNDIGFDMNLVIDISSIEPDDLSICEALQATHPFYLGDLPERAEAHFQALDSYLLRNSTNGEI